MAFDCIIVVVVIVIFFSVFLAFLSSVVLGWLGT
jgi:hypothetical protein